MIVYVACDYTIPNKAYLHCCSSIYIYIYKYIHTCMNTHTHTCTHTHMHHTHTSNTKCIWHIVPDSMIETSAHTCVVGLYPALLQQVRATETRSVPQHFSLAATFSLSLRYLCTWKETLPLNWTLKWCCQFLGYVLFHMMFLGQDMCWRDTAHKWHQVTLICP